MKNEKNDSDTSADLHGATVRRLLRGAVSRGEITVAAVPGMVDDYVKMCDDIFIAMGVRYSAEDLQRLRTVLAGQLAAAYSASSRSSIVITYEIPVGTVANYQVRPHWFTVSQAYDNWVATREPPLFGTEPDARVWAAASAAGDPSSFPILDIGAGTGRNSLALARRGHPVDAVEMSGGFAAILGEEARRDGLNVRVLQRDVFETRADLRTDYQLIVLSEVVSDFRTTEQVRRMFELAAACLAPGAHLLFNVFLARDGYQPDAAVRQLGEQTYTSIFTYPELAEAASGLPLERVSDESVYDYEKANLPAEKWPPTSWYANWVSGLDVFDVPREECPIELRWLVYRKN